MILYRKDIEDKIDILVNCVLKRPQMYNIETIGICFSDVVKELRDYDELKKLDK